MNDEMTRLVRSLNLPIEPSSLADGVVAATVTLDRHGHRGQDAVDQLNLDISTWISGGECTELLADVIAACIAAAGGPDVRRLFARSYTSLIDRHSTRFGLTRTEARMLLGRARFFVLLASEGMSASQISRLQRSLEPLVDPPWRLIQDITAGSGLRPTVSPGEMSQLWEADAERARNLFPDGDYLDACTAAAEACEALGPLVSLKSELAALLSNGDVQITAPPIHYLQILHFALSPLEWFDHCPTMLYEFAPRGQAANWLFNQYNVPTGNPVLNNAKSVEVLDVAWARSKDTRSSAALVAVLQLVEQLPFGARREVAAILRSWLHRTRDLMITPTLLLPDSPSEPSVRQALSAIAQEGTQTAGVIEQRVVDAAVAYRHRGDKWRPRGLGDPVNASNLSRRKLGDVEMQSADDRLAVAYEAHGGILTAPYVEGHRRSLRRSLGRRYAEEWIHVADAGEWRVKVVFVAHAIAPDIDLTDEDVGGIRVTFEARTYGDFFSASFPEGIDDVVLDHFAEHVHHALNRRTTPAETRSRYGELAGLGLRDAASFSS
jgi:hypothetical protein